MDARNVLRARYYSTYILLIILFFTSSAFASAKSQALVKKLNKTVSRYRKVYNIPALSVSVSFSNGYVLNLHSGTIKLGSKDSINNDSLFQVGSVTKTFVAVVILKLVAEGKIKLNAPLTTYLPRYKKWKHITVRQLLNHTSGIFNYTALGRFDHIYQDKYNHTQWEPQEIVQYAYRRRLYFKPGRDWKYSNTNYILLGMIIHKVTGRPVAENLQTFILSPYHLNRMFYVTHRYPKWIKQHLVHGYYAKMDKTNINMSWAGAAGALVSNSADLARWGRILFTKNLLPEQQLDELKSVVSPATGQPLSPVSNEFGYGLGIKRRYFPKYGDVWYHTGTTTGYTAIYFWVPNMNIAVSVLTNKGELPYTARKNIAMSVLNLIRQYH